MPCNYLVTTIYSEVGLDVGTSPTLLRRYLNLLLYDVSIYQDPPPFAGTGTTRAARTQYDQQAAPDLDRR